jgi:RecJ-like exonuclease
VDQVLGLQRQGNQVTDPITCPECEGRGETSIGPLRLLCRFCQGRGQVGGEFEPAEGGHQRTDGYRLPEDGEEYDPDVHGPLPAVWEHPAVEGVPCSRCLGSGTVINLGGDMLREQVHGRLVETPCPACSAKQS